jgi:hypothetical protein
MNKNALLVEVLLAGFFAIACIKAHGPFKVDSKNKLSDFFHLSNRLERLRRSRWQWFSMVLLVLALRMVQGEPLIVELIVIVQLIVFLALPTQASVLRGVRVR